MNFKNASFELQTRSRKRDNFRNVKKVEYLDRSFGKCKQNKHT